MNRTLPVLALVVLFAGLNACSKKGSHEDVGITPEILSKISALGFNPSDAFSVEGGYVVEGDIFLAAEDLERGSLKTGANLIIAEEEHYSTTNTANPGNYTISLTGGNNGNLSAALDEAISRYNARGLTISFTRVNGGNADIRVKTDRKMQGGLVGEAGFPNELGEPYGQIKMNHDFINAPETFLATVLAHEIGHCIGFRHTDYMTRESCGSGGGELEGTIGAVQIPGTPSGFDADSWMLACLNNGVLNRPFTSNDIIALEYLW